MYSKVINLYEKEITSIKQELSKLPVGHLTKQKHYYYERIGNLQKGITKDPQRVKQLARKAYLLRRLKHIESNYTLIKKQIKRFKTEEPKDIIKGMPSCYKSLPEFYFFHSTVQNQLDSISQGNVGHQNELIYLTDSGIRVRSKSERMIADALDKNKIPYRYEAELILGGYRKYPDFVIYRPSDGKVFLWEHFGLMDNEGYQKNTTEKIALYARHGFFPNDNLICTYEHDLKNLLKIHALIEIFLLF